MSERDDFFDGWKRPMYDRLDTPLRIELERLAASGDPLDSAIVELWRGRSIVSSVKAARLSREQADAILRALGEMPAVSVRPEGEQT